MDKDKKEDCVYWDKCYRLNEDHRNKYNHPNPTTETQVHANGNSVNEKSLEETKTAVEEATDIEPPKPGVEIKGNSEPPRAITTECRTSTNNNAPKLPVKSPNGINGDDANGPSTSRMSVNNANGPSTSRMSSDNENGPSTSASARNENALKRKFDEDTTDVEKTRRESPPRVQSARDSFTFLVRSLKYMETYFLIEMPKDLYLFHDFRKYANHAKPTQNIFDNFGLDMVGPFEYLDGKVLQGKTVEDHIVHWRFYYDPPEFQTLFVKRGTGIHYGYWRDDHVDSEQQHLLIARNDFTKGCQFDIIASNCFDALAYFLEKDFVPNTFTRAPLAKVRKSLNEYVSMKRYERAHLIILKKNRNKTVVAKTFHGCGIVAPVDKNGVGYRPLIESDAELKNILSFLDKPEDAEEAFKIVAEKLQPIITAAVIAADEGDFGTALELGLDLFSSGHTQLHPIVLKLLEPAYTLLKRPIHLSILKYHLARREKKLSLNYLV